MYKITKGLYEGLIFTIFAELPDSKLPLMKRYKRARDKFTPKERWGIFYYAGIVFAEPLVEALKRCGRNLTADSFVDAMETLKDFKGIGPKITFGPNRRHGSQSSYLGQCKERGKAVLISDLRAAKIDVDKVIERLAR
jgi:hypothetical protein